MGGRRSGALAGLSALLALGALRADLRQSGSAAAVDRPVAPAEDALGLTVRQVIALQIALEARGFSAGLLDGVEGAKTRLALAGLQAALGLPVTGQASPATLEVLAPDPERALAPVRIAAADLEEVDPAPKDWIERSRKTRLLYASLASLVAERTHTTERLLAAANPRLDMAALKPGDVLWAPAAPAERRLVRPAQRIEIDLERKLVLLLAGSERRAPPVAVLNCSIAADPARAPVGDTQVMVVAENPIYTFDPAKWPEVKGIDRKLQIPPGPRSPVGIRWIGLELDGIGIHGSPEPENIGKTGSHGCFRLTNWDAVWLAGLAAPGTQVRIVKTARESSWSWPR